VRHGRAALLGEATQQVCLLGFQRDLRSLHTDMIQLLIRDVSPDSARDS
jgi:hypothetical protein